VTTGPVVPAPPKAAGSPAVFLRYQQELLTTVSHHAVTVVEKSRRTGYSWAIAAIAALTAARTRSAGGMDAFYMGYNLDMAREFIEYVGEWAKHFDPAAGEAGEYFFPDPSNPDKTIQAFRITFASGFKVVALPSVARALRGMQGMVILDEAAFHDDLAEVMKAAFALLIWGGRVVIISTHDGDENPFNQLVQEIRAARKPYALLRCTFDDALADGLYRRICEQKGREWTPDAEAEWRDQIIAFYGGAADEELFCIPRRGGGAYFPMGLVEACAEEDIPVFRLELPDTFASQPAHIREAEVRDWCEEQLAPALAVLDPQARHHFGQDFARSGDLSCIWPVAVTRTMARRTPFTVELRNVPFEQQRQILFYVADRLPRFAGGDMDAGGNGAYLAEVAWQRYGEQLIRKVHFTADWYRENMPPVKAAFEDRAFSIPKDRDTIDDFRMVRIVGGVPRVPDQRRTESGGKGKKRHGDAAIAGVLAYTASRLPAQEYDYIPADAGARAANPNHDVDPDHEDLGRLGFASNRAW
jgi:phage FluMu gp28-like protein